MGAAHKADQDLYLYDFNLFYELLAFIIEYFKLSCLDPEDAAMQVYCQLMHTNLLKCFLFLFIAR